jgi:hypothetical protein
MKWITQRNVTVDGVACPWLITRFLDDDAEFAFVPEEDVLRVAEREDGLSFGVPGARYAARNGKCVFEVLIEEHGLVAYGLDTLAQIVHAATSDEAGAREVPEGPGLRAIAAGFMIAAEDDIERQRLQWPVYDALLAWCASREEGTA